MPHNEPDNLIREVNLTDRPSFRDWLAKPASTKKAPPFPVTPRPMPPPPTDADVPAEEPYQEQEEPF